MSYNESHGGEAEKSFRTSESHIGWLGEIGNLPLINKACVLVDQSVNEIGDAARKLTTDTAEKAFNQFGL